MKYEERRTGSVDAFPVRGCEIIIRRRDSIEVKAEEGDMIVFNSSGMITVMDREDFIKKYEDS